MWHCAREASAASCACPAPRSNTSCRPKRLQAAWLYRATGEASYLTAAQNYLKRAQVGWLAVPLQLATPLPLLLLLLLRGRRRRRCCCWHTCMCRL